MQSYPHSSRLNLLLFLKESIQTLIRIIIKPVCFTDVQFFRGHTLYLLSFLFELSVERLLCLKVHLFMFRIVQNGIFCEFCRNNLQVSYCCIFILIVKVSSVLTFDNSGIISCVSSGLLGFC